MNKLLLSAVAAAAGISMLAPQPLSAAIVFAEGIHVTAQGFGNRPRILTVQEKGNGDDVESACVAVGAGATLIGGAGACISDASVFQGNGVSNGGLDEVDPLTDNQKFGIPTIGELGWVNAGDIGLLFNAVEPGGDRVVINDVTLKFYNGTSLIAAIDGQHTLESTNPGNGVAGFVFLVDQPQQAFLNGTVFNQANFGNFRIALESTISDAQGGPESWLAFNASAIPEPGAWALLIVGFGVVGGMMRRRRGPRLSLA